MKTFAFFIGLALSLPLAAQANSSGTNDLVLLIRGAPIFSMPVSWVGEKKPEGQENEDLWNALKGFSADPEKGISALEAFAGAHPNSAWLPSVNANLAEFFRNTGSYSLALSHWEKAWGECKDLKDPNSIGVSSRIAAHWTRLLGSLGRKPDLETVLREASERGLDSTPYATMLQGSRDGLVAMSAEPGSAYRCGSYALAQVFKVLTPNNRGWTNLALAVSPEGGFKMSDLARLASENQMDMVPAKRIANAEIIVPSVVHWKLNHYAAIVARDGARYKVVDSTFGEPRWISEKTLITEASGNFLVPRNQLNKSWSPLSPEDAAQVYGKGYPNDIDDPDDCEPDPDDCDPREPTGSNDGSCVWDDPSGENCKKKCPPPDDAGSGNDDDGDDDGDIAPFDEDTGMPHWRVSEPFISLWLEDVPLFYNSSGGPRKLHVSYNHRGLPKDGHFSSFGDRWECNWLNYLTGTAGSTTYKEAVRGGGTRSFPADGSREYMTGNFMRPELAHNTPTIVDTRNKEKDFLNALIQGSSTNYYLSDLTDQFGRKTHLDYETNTIGGSTIIRLLRVYDLDGKYFTFAYTNTTYPQLITSVTDPYSRAARFNYDTNGWLTNITDAAGMSSSFQYDSTGFITNLHTVYGNTGFKYFTSTNLISSSRLNRALEITEPSGDKQLYSYRDNSDTSTGAGVYNTFDTAGNNWNYRNSFHWNRRQFGMISAQGLTNYLTMTGPDYCVASLKHWLHKGPVGTMKVSDTLSDSAGPFLNDPSTSSARSNPINYAYHGQTDTAFEGDVAWVTRIRKVKGGPIGAQFHEVDFYRNESGHPTNIIHSGDSGFFSSFTNQYDLGGTRLLKQWGPRGELLGGYGYAATNSSLVTSITNALGEVTTFTHLPDILHVTTTTLPSGLVVSNIYYNSGAYSNFLQTTMQVGIRTNGFVYTNGNRWVITNSLGLVLTRSRDALNRLTQTAFPDGTTISNVYDKLDVSAVKDRMGNWTTFTHNVLQQLTARTNANGEATLFQYCSCGSLSELIKILGTRSLITQFSYDASGNMTNVIYPDNYSVAYEYGFDGRASKATDSSTRQVDFYYNDFGKLQHVDLGPYTAYLDRSFDEYNRVTNSVNRNGVSTTNNYDSLGRIVTRRVVGAGGWDQTGIETFEYNSRGLTNYTDALGKVTRYVRDQAGRVLRQTNANNETLQFTYNQRGEILTLTDGKNQTTIWRYDEFGRVTNKLDALNAEMFRYQYDKDGRLTNRWQAGSITTTYRYDPIGNLTNVVYPTSSNIVFKYDDLNRITNMIDGVGSTAFAWTDGGQLASEDGPWDSDKISYSYLNRTRSSLNLQQPYASDWVQSYDYDNQWRLADVTSPAGTFTYNYISSYNDPYTYASDLVYYLAMPGGSHTDKAFDSLGRLTNSALLSGSTILDSHAYAYNGGNQRTRQVFTAGNYTDYGYDNIGQLISAKGTESDTTTARLNEQFGYGYDAAWNLNVRTNNALIQNFAVNSLNELSNSFRSGTLTVAGSISEALAPDPYSYGVTNVTVNGSTANLYADRTFAKTGFTPADGSNTYTAVARDTTGRQDTDVITAYLPATNTFTYDARGNLTSDGHRFFTYDDENQLISVTVSNAYRSEFTYDGFLRKRVLKDFGWFAGAWVETNEVRFVYDGRLVVQERDADNLPHVSYTTGSDLSGAREGAGGIGGLLARTDNRLLALGTTDGSAVYGFDGNGNVTAMATTNGTVAAKYSYDPFGNTLSKTGPLSEANKYRFSTKEIHMNSGLLHFQYRMFDPSLQKWLSRDPIQERGGINLFASFKNDPLDLLDPLGLQPGVPPRLPTEECDLEREGMPMSGVVVRRPLDLGPARGGRPRSRPPSEDREPVRLPIIANNPLFEAAGKLFELHVSLQEAEEQIDFQRENQGCHTANGPGGTFQMSYVPPPPPVLIMSGGASPAPVYPVSRNAPPPASLPIGL